ncbi:MAG: hypothetical protein K2Y13_01120 [Burkholderiaceae bacterium]|uniref:NIPSNAP protein n=1 Tax=Herminiimonas contaminans TaxID=1111140 RepID=A0ABS0EWI0_9BURK|nr:DUF6176 family protein [Herminiimonas contaminans]MBF8179202.1 hypothetical protein [Herminiimonas contaminans]MBX9798035.1 hypothetical protein [Burkholderiaceae bacterium]
MNTKNEVVCARIRLKPDSLPLVREWAAYIAAHREEALRTLEAEGVVIESVFLDTVEGVDYLVYYMRAPSLKKAEVVAVKSLADVDLYHQNFKKTTWEKVSRLELLVDLDRSNT